VSRPLPAEDQTPIPERILVRYNQDYNIAHLDAIIRRKLTVEQRQRALLLKRTLIQERENVRSPQTVLDRRISLDNIASYEAELDEPAADSALGPGGSPSLASEARVP